MSRKALCITFALLLCFATLAFAQQPETSPAVAPVQETAAPAPATEPAAQASTAAPEFQYATVVFFRPKRFFGSGLTPSVVVDETEIARLDNGRYVTFRVKPGKRTLASSMKSHAGLEMEFKAGETYYIEMAIQSGNWRGGGRLIPAPAQDAKEALKKLKLLDAKWVTKPEKAELAQHDPTEQLPK